MIRRKKILALAAAIGCLALAIIIAVVGSRNTLKHEGRTLVEWVLQLQSARVADREQAREVVDSLGPAATPELIRLLGTTDFPYEAEYGRMRLRFPQLFRLLPRNESAFMLRNTVMSLLKERPREEMLEHLEHIVVLLDSREPDVRTRAATLLSWLGTPAHLAINDLAQAVKEDSSFSMVVHAISRIGMPYATNAFPALERALQFDSISHRITAANTLAFLAKDTPGLPEALVAILETGDEAQKQHALNSLLILTWRAYDVLPRIEAEAERTFSPRMKERMEKLADSIRRSHAHREAALNASEPE